MEEAKEKTVNGSKKVKTIQVGSFLIIVFLLIYIPSFIHWLYGKSIATDILKDGSIEEAVNTEAYLIRNEEALNSTFSGKCITNVEEGERVAKGYKIATVLNESSEKLYNDLKEKDLEILKVQRTKTENQGIFSEDIIKLDKEIENKLAQLIYSKDTNSFSETKKIKDGIDELVRKKAKILSGSGLSDGHINELKNQRNEIQQIIKSNTVDVYSKEPGIVSFSVDGYENILRPGAISKLLPKDLEGISVENTKKNINNFNVTVEKPFAKLIKDLELYMVAVLNPREADKFSVDDKISIRINEISDVFEGTIDYKSKEEDGKVIISIRTQRGISETAGFRKINIDLIKTSYTGLKIPLKSLRNTDDKENTAEIVLVKGSYAKVSKVKIIGKDDEYAIIDNAGGNESGNTIGLYDLFALTPGKIQEGQMVNQ